MNIISTIQATKFGIKNTKLKNKQKLNFKGNSTKDSLIIQGTQTKAKVYTNNIDNKTIEQIKTICSHPAFKDVPVRIMPDVHAGKNVPVGFTAPIGPKGEIIPSLISGDIGCGMLCCEIDTNNREIDYKQLDNIIRTYISNSHNKVPEAKKQHLASIEKELKDLCDNKLGISSAKIISGLGTLGGGNHFVEIDKSNKGETYLIIHTGSRGFGQSVYNYHNNIAMKQNPYIEKDLSYLTGTEAKQYLADMQLAQKYAKLNRRIIADTIIQNMGWKEVSNFESIHNYLSKDNIIRKGAISSYNGQKILIPLNMRDGALIAIGKGNSDWNYSAPHGAGRKLSRSEAQKNININDYKESMKGIYTTCICDSTIDESPMAYKNSDEIKSGIIPTATIIENVRPQYNFKNSR